MTAGLGMPGYGPFSDPAWPGRLRSGRWRVAPEERMDSKTQAPAILNETTKEVTASLTKSLSYE
jgi:hypothetical protein